MPATGGSEEPAAPVPSTVPPDSEQVVLTEEDEIAELGAVPTADPDRVAEDEAADEGDLQPRQFLGAGGDGLGGAEEPVHDDALPPEVSVSTAPASTPAATGCTPKAWQAKNLPAFKDKDNLTEEFLQHFEPFPKPKATPWVEQPADFRNTEQCDEERLGSRLQGRPQHEVLARHEGARARSRASYCQGDHGPAVAALCLPADQILAQPGEHVGQLPAPGVHGTRGCRLPTSPLARTLSAEREKSF